MLIKKTFSAAIVFLGLMLLSFSNVSAATVQNAGTRHIGVLIVGAADYKTARYYNSIKSRLNPQKNSSIVIEVGDEIQSKYMTYWAQKGFLKEQSPDKQDMINFAKISGYDKVLYIVPSNFFSSDQTLYAKNIWQAFLVGDVDISTASIEMLAVLCNGDEIIKHYNTTYEFNTLQNDDKSSLKKTAFNHCIRMIGQEFVDDL